MLLLAYGAHMAYPLLDYLIAIGREFLLLVGAFPADESLAYLAARVPHLGRSDLNCAGRTGGV